LAYSVEVIDEAKLELKALFSLHEQEQIISKLRKIAENAPTSLKLKNVTLLKGADAFLTKIEADAAYELRIGRGHRAAFVVFHKQQLILVYMAGPHDYANKLFLKALSRLEPPDTSTTS
jgi:hypothetical protein